MKTIKVRLDELVKVAFDKGMTGQYYESTESDNRVWVSYNAVITDKVQSFDRFEIKASILEDDK